MEIKEKHIRTISAIIIGMVISILGVFLFSNFVYRGTRIGDLFQDYQGETAVNKFFYGLYRLLGSGLEVNIFRDYSSENNQLSTFVNSSLPVILTWFLAGFLSGFLITGAKKGAGLASIIFGVIFVLWLFSGLIGGEGLGQLFINEFLSTFLKIFVALILISLGGTLGGYLSGRKAND